jgi:hypothetical protein
VILVLIRSLQQARIHLIHSSFCAVSTIPLPLSNLFTSDCQIHRRPFTLPPACLFHQRGLFSHAESSLAHPCQRLRGVLRVVALTSSEGRNSNNHKGSFGVSRVRIGKSHYDSLYKFQSQNAIVSTSYFTNSKSTYTLPFHPIPKPQLWLVYIAPDPNANRS